jgi:hypothetical protein
VLQAFRVIWRLSSLSGAWCLVQCGECREHKRWIERENARLRSKAKKEETRRLREFVDRSYQLDPRVLARKEVLRQEKENKKLEKMRAQKVSHPSVRSGHNCTIARASSIHTKAWLSELLHDSVSSACISLDDSMVYLHLGCIQWGHKSGTEPSGAG